MKNEENNLGISTQQKELLSFVSPKNSEAVSDDLKTVFDMALYDSEQPVNSRQKDALFTLDKLIKVIKSVQVSLLFISLRLNLFEFNFLEELDLIPV